MKSCSHSRLAIFLSSKHCISDKPKINFIPSGRRFYLIALFFIFVLSSSASAQQILKRLSNAVLIDIDQNSGIHIGDRVSVIRTDAYGMEIQVGIVEIVRYQKDQCGARIISEEPGIAVSAGDRIELYAAADDFASQNNMDGNETITADTISASSESDYEILKRVNDAVLIDADMTSGLNKGDHAAVIRKDAHGNLIKIGVVQIVSYHDGRCAALIIQEYDGFSVAAGDKIEIGDSAAKQADFAYTGSAPSSFLQKLEETLGINFIYQKITHKSGRGDVYTCVDIPLEFVYTPSRYMTFRIILNQGYQSFANMGIYGLSDLYINARYLRGKNMTLFGGIIIPTGKKGLAPEEIAAASAGRIPFINAPVLTGHTGFGLNFGIAHGVEISEQTSLALGISYRLRTSYKPVKYGDKYSPANEFVFAAGVNSGDKRNGFTADARLSLYSGEKLNGIKFTDGSAGLSVTVAGYFQNIRLNTLYYQRQTSELVYGGDFKPPMIFNIKAGVKNLLGIYNFVPYVGFEHTGEGSLMDAASLILIGGYFEDFQIKGYPLSPFLQIGFGKAGDDLSTLGFRAGTNISFQVY